MQGKGLRILVLTLNIYNGNNGKGLFRLLILAILTQWSVVYTNMSFLQEKISRQEFKINLITFLSLMINCIFSYFLLSIRVYLKFVVPQRGGTRLTGDVTYYN